MDNYNLLLLLLLLLFVSSATPLYGPYAFQAGIEVTPLLLC
jgi:hypothetical protein